MATQLNQGAARSIPTCAPAAWLSAFVSIGGGYAFASGRKLGLVIEVCAWRKHAEEACVA